MELLQLRYFLAVVEEENITRVAAKNHVAQSAVSKAIAKLESELNCRFFDRNGPKISINEQGRLFAHHIRNALSSIDEGVLELTKTHTDRSMTAKICVYEGHFLLSKLEREFVRAYPQYKIETLSDTDTEKAELFVQELPDFAFGSVAVPILEKEYVAVLSRQSPLVQLPYLEFSDMQQFPYIQPDINRVEIAGPLDDNKYYLRLGFQPSIISHTINLKALQQRIVGINGITIWPAASLSIIMSDDLTAMRIGENGTFRPLYMTKRENAMISSAAETFFAFASEQYRIHHNM